MGKVLRPCLDCGALFVGTTRCPPCRRVREQVRDMQRGSRSERGYGPAWARMSRETREAHPWCSLCGSTSDLTVDHVVPLAHGGTHDQDNVRVLCRSCNGSLGGSVRRDTRGGGGSSRNTSPHSTPAPLFSTHSADSSRD